MVREIAFVISAAALLIAAAEAFLLARGAPRREARTWIVFGIVLLLGAAQRINIGVRGLLGEILPLPQGVEFTLLVNTIVVAATLWFLRPILMGYRAAEERRQMADERFRRALSESREPMAIINSTGEYTYVNDPGCAFFMYPRERILGRHFRDFVVDVEPESKGTVERAFREGAASVEREILRGDGKRIVVESELITLGDGSILIIGHDLTERRRVMQAQVRIQRLEAVGALGAGLAHDFNNLLTIIRGALELASEYGTERVSLDGAVRATKRASSLAQELIDFSRVAIEHASRPEPDVIDIRNVAAESNRAVSTNLDHRVEMDFAYEPLPVLVRADPRDIDRICTNLLVNARDAIIEVIGTEPGSGQSGRIEMVIRSGESGPHDELLAEIVVRDTGPGVPTDLRDRIFEPFFSTKADGRGFGLGLAATHELVAALGGSIDVGPRDGGGAVFTVRLPIAREAAPVASAIA